MPNYELNRLGEKEFERMCQSLLKAVIGNGTITFGEGPDGGREATFTGQAPYPSQTDQWNGEWIFQVKFHNTELLGVEEARKQLLRDLETELDKIINKYERTCNNYILITNVPLSSVNKRGTHDRIANEVIPKFGNKIAHVHIWGADDINRFLENYSTVRQAYLHFLTSGDLIAEIMGRHGYRSNELALVMQHFMTKSFRLDQYTQLDQAGKVDDDALLLQNVFIDLDIQIQHSGKFEASDVEEHFGNDKENRPAMQLLLSEKFPKIVLIGGPGEGKSTLGQFLAQIHRATLLGRLNELLTSDEDKQKWMPLVPRIPFRILLKDYAQWLTEGENSEKALEVYLCERVQKLAEEVISTKDIRHIFQKNPCLLVLDGLDEVMNLGLRALMLEKIAEFLDRCEHVLAANIQILATTRPMGYSNQFDPSRFVHLLLVHLEPPKIHEYVSKWSQAKRLDSDKAENLATSIKECLETSHIGFLMRTPLQVSILILIIQTGGTPPKQREELFNEYLEIIYKREKAKSKMIIQTKKDLLFGLHEYLGYVLHSQSITAKDTGSALKKSEFISHVTMFLKSKKPQWDKRVLEEHVAMIVREASERLVLIVGLPNETYGFELRTFQEFFAAIYLVNAKTSNQRFKRFESIIPSAHWRTVALFFAGRVGRIYSAEAAMILEVCRDLDRCEPDTWLRRGERLALELAVEQAFGSNGKLQRSAIEYGLNLVNVEPDSNRFGTIQHMLEQLPDEDIQEHVLPVLKDRIRLLPRPYFEGAVNLYYELEPSDNSLLEAMNRFFRSNNLDDQLFAVSKSLKLKLDPTWVVYHLKNLLCIIPLENFYPILGEEGMLYPLYILECMINLNLNNDQISSFFAFFLSNYNNYKAIYEKEDDVPYKEKSANLDFSNPITLFFYAISIMNIFCQEQQIFLSQEVKVVQGVDFFLYSSKEEFLSMKSELIERLSPLIQFLQQQKKEGAVEIPQITFLSEMCKWFFQFLTEANTISLIQPFSIFFSNAKACYPWIRELFIRYGNLIHPFLPFLIEMMDINMSIVTNETHLLKDLASSDPDKISNLIYVFLENVKHSFSRDQIIRLLLTKNFTNRDVKMLIKAEIEIEGKILLEIMIELIRERLSFLVSPSPDPIKGEIILLILGEIYRDVKSNIHIEAQINSIMRLCFFPWKKSNQDFHVAIDLIFTLIDQAELNPRLGLSAFNLLIRLLNVTSIPKDTLALMLKSIASIDMNKLDHLPSYELQNPELMLTQLEYFWLHTDVTIALGAAKLFNLTSKNFNTYRKQKNRMRTDKLSISLETAFRFILEDEIEFRCLGINILTLLSSSLEKNSKKILELIKLCKNEKEAIAWRILLKGTIVLIANKNTIDIKNFVKSILQEKQLIMPMIVTEALWLLDYLVISNSSESLLDEKALDLLLTDQ